MMDATVNPRTGSTGRRRRFTAVAAVTASLAFVLIGLSGLGRSGGGSGTLAVTDQTAPGASEPEVLPTVQTQPAPTVPETTDPQSPPEDEPPVVLLIGDSLTYETSDSIDDHLEAGGYDVYAHATPGLGLLSPDADFMQNWMTDIERLIEDLSPDVVVAEFVGNYSTAYALDESGESIEVRSEAFYDAWATAADQMATAITDSGAELLWVVPPPMASPLDDDLAAHTARIAESYRSEFASAWPDVELVDWWTPFADQAGNFASVVPGADGEPIEAREPDGVHLSDQGEELAASIVATAVTN